MGSLGPCGIPESSHGHLRPAAQTSLVWRVLLYPVHGKAALVLSCPCSSPQHTNPPGSWGSSKPRVWLQGLESALASGSFRALQCHSATSASLLFPVWSQYDPSMVPAPCAGPGSQAAGSAAFSALPCSGGARAQAGAQIPRQCQIRYSSAEGDASSAAGVRRC